MKSHKIILRSVLLVGSLLLSGCLTTSGGKGGIPGLPGMPSMPRLPGIGVTIAPVDTVAQGVTLAE